MSEANHGRLIVGEVSCTYSELDDVERVHERVSGPMGTIGKRFEHVCEVNASRGYRLHSWKFTTVAFSFGDPPAVKITETIVAVFEKEDVRAGNELS